MITKEILESFGFEQNETEKDKFALNNLNVYLKDDKIEWINEGDNYNGLHVNITTSKQIANLISIR